MREYCIEKILRKSSGEYHYNWEKLENTAQIQKYSVNRFLLSSRVRISNLTIFEKIFESIFYFLIWWIRIKIQSCKNHTPICTIWFGQRAKTLDIFWILPKFSINQQESSSNQQISNRTLRACCSWTFSSR